MGTLEESVKCLCRESGFDLVGITSAAPFLRDRAASLERVRNGLMDGLPWYTEERVLKATDPQFLLPGAKSVISVAISYNTGDAPQLDGTPRGRFAKYAWNEDYHQVMKTRLSQIVEGLERIAGHSIKTRNFVDDGPMNDRAAAERAGLGWFGKNTNILTPSLGSWVLLGQIITTLELEPDTPLKKNCGDCIRCLVDCPTGAIVGPYVVDNRKCISFLTIELRGSIPINLRHLIGDWVFGCDICQDVCPVNRNVPVTLDPAFQKRHDFDAPALLPLLELDDDGFRERFRNSPIKRAKRVGLQRNVCVALGNIGNRAAIPALENVLATKEPLVRQHAAWALGQLGGPNAKQVLQKFILDEADPVVLEELELALSELIAGGDST